MKIRFHRGTLAESMETVEDVDPTMIGVMEAMQRAGYPPTLVSVSPYCFDPRTGWDTHIVTTYPDGYGVAFTDGPLEDRYFEAKQPLTLSDGALESIAHVVGLFGRLMSRP